MHIVKFLVSFFLNLSAVEQTITILCLEKKTYH